MHQQGAQEPQAMQPQQAVNIVLLVLQAFAVVPEVFLHKGIGCRYLDKQAALAVLVIPGFVLVWPEEDPTGLIYLLGAYFVRCAALRLSHLRRKKIERGGVVEHSRYPGWPAILDGPLGRRLTEPTAKAFVEPVLVLVTGALLCELSEPLGSFLMVSAFCLFATAKARITFERTRMMDLRDAQIDQRNMSERFRRDDW
jgi:hypothetical protein